MSPPGARGRALSTGLLVLAGLVVVGRFAVDAWLFKPTPTRLPTDAAAGPAPARVPRAAPPAFLLGIVDGLRAEAVAPSDDPAMPTWASLSREGASGIGMAGEPTLTACCVRTLLTGRNPDLYTAFRNFTAGAARGSLTQFLAERGVRAAHAGDAAAWQMAQAYYADADVLAFPDQGPKDQGGTDDRAFPFALEKAKDPGVGFLTFHVVRPDHAGHKHGATGAEYREACAVVDGQLRQVVEAFRAAHPGAYVLLSADHGVTPRGTHGGGEPGARRAPFVLVGPRVARVAEADVPQSSLAPTVATLLGLPMPPLAETPPALELTTLTPGERASTLDAYVASRVAVAQGLGAADIAEAIDARRRQVFVEGSALALERLASAYRDLEAQAFASVGTGAAALALLLAACWLSSLVRGRADAGSSTLPILAALGTLAVGFAGPPALAAAALLVACAAYMGPPARVPEGARRVALAGLVALPVLGAAALLLQDAFDATEDAGPAALRTALVLGSVVLLGAAVLARRDVRGRLGTLLSTHPALLAAVGGVALGFTLSLRLFIDPFVHTPILFALAGGAAVLAIAWRGHATRRAALALGAIAALLFGGGRVLEGLFPDWILSPRGVSFAWKGAALCGVLALAWRARATSRADLPTLCAAGAALVAAAVLRVGAPDTFVPWALALGFGLAALVGTLFVGTPDGRLTARLLAATALASVLHERSDAQLLGFVLLALGAWAGSTLSTPRTRLGVAWLALGILAIRLAVFHAMGFTESFSTIDTGAGIVPGAGQAAADARGGGLTPDVVVNGLLMALKYGLVWIALLAAVVRACEREGRLEAVPTLVGDLAITYASRSAAITIGMWVWWRSSWWVATAYPVFALSLIEVVLLLGAYLLTGWARAPVAASDGRGERTASESLATVRN